MNSPTHHWIKRLADIRKPAYLAIPDLIEEDLATGRLRPRDRLPGLRDLAEELALNYTTVARAYAEARKRGLLDSRAGSGTFVRGRTATLPLAGGSSIEMSMNTPPEPPDYATRLRDSAARLMAACDPYQLLRYQDFGGSAADKDAGAEWLKRRVPHCDAQNVLVCPGIHSALVALVSQLARPGGTICLDYARLPRHQGDRRATRRAPAGACRATTKARSRMPSKRSARPTNRARSIAIRRLQNPSTLTLTHKRREALADVALRYSVPIIEDDAYAMLPQSAPDALASLRAGTDLLRDGIIEELRRGLARRASACADCRGKRSALPARCARPR